MTRDAEHTPTGYEDAASVVVNQAPAPSSLAGGALLADDAILKAATAVRESSVAWATDPEEFEHLIELTPDEIRKLFSALSPEAPAREGGEHQTVGPIDYDKLRSIIHSATNAVLPFANAPMKTPFSTQERAGMQVEIADLIVADLEKAGGKTPAPTPRHEAPADHHERNLTASNTELIEQALSHPPLEAPASEGEV